MDPSNPSNFFSNPQKFSVSQDYYPNLDDIHTQDFGTGSNPHFPDDPTHENVQPTNTNTNTNTSSGPKGWTDQEDMALMYAWVTASENAIVGKSQTIQTFWSRIWNMYQESRALHPRLMGDERSIESLRNRYKRLNANVTKWVAAYKEAYSQKSSCMSDADVEKEAQKLYSSGKSSKFTHHEVFEKIMSHHVNWELKLGAERHRTRVEYADDADVEEDHGSSKKSKTTGEGEDPNNSTSETGASESSTIRRPGDRDEAKVKRKGKATVSQQSLIPDEYTAELQAMRITREKEVDAINKMGEIRLQSSKMNMLNTLLVKSNLSPKEESLKNRLMAELFPN